MACFDPNTNLLWATPYGGEDNDAILDMAIDDGTNRLVLVGATESLGNPGGANCALSGTFFPQCATGSQFAQVDCNGTSTGCPSYSDGFIALFSLDMDWIWSSRFGTQTFDRITSAAFGRCRGQHGLLWEHPGCKNLSNDKF